MAHMTRDDGWRFLSLGRHLERLHLSPARSTTSRRRGAAGPGLLEWLLDLSDSLITYRARYLQQPEWERSSICCSSTSATRGRRSSSWRSSRSTCVCCRTPALIDVLAEVERLLRDCGRPSTRTRASCSAGRAAARGAADGMPATWPSRLGSALTLRYFSHVYDVPRATVGCMTDAVYRIEHETRYVHAGGVSTSQHVACLTPRTLPHQRVQWHELAIEPAPASRVAAHRLLRQRRPSVHDSDAVRRAARGRAQRRRGRARRADRSPAIPACRGKRCATSCSTSAARRRRRGGVPLSVAVRRAPRRSSRRSRVESFAPQRPLVAAAVDLMHRIHEEFTFDPGRDDDHDAGHARARRSPRRLPGLRAPADRLSALARAGRALRQRLSADRPAAGTAAAGRRRCLARLALRLCPALGWVDLDPDQRRPCRRSATSPSPGAATTATSARCAASCSAAATTRSTSASASRRRRRTRRLDDCPCVARTTIAHARSDPLVSSPSAIRRHRNLPDGFPQNE